MHVLAMVSMLLFSGLSLMVRLPDDYDYCICKYRPWSSLSSTNLETLATGWGMLSEGSPTRPRRLRGVGRVGPVPLHVGRRTVDRRDRLAPCQSPGRPDLSKTLVLLS